MRTSREGACYDACIGKNAFADGVFQFCCLFLQACYLLVAVLAVALAAIVELTYVATYAPKLVIERMALEAPLVGVLKHAVGDACGVAYAQDIHAAFGEFLAYPIHRHVALGANEHLHFAVQGFVDGLHECGGFSCSRRTVYHGHVLGTEHHVGSLFLRRVEPREAHGGKREFRCRSSGVADVAQLCQAVAFG